MIENSYCTVNRNHVNARTIWDYWWRGNPAAHLPPYHVLRGFDLQNKPEKIRLSKARSFITWLLKFGGFEANAVNTYVREQRLDDLDAAFELCFQALIESVMGDLTNEEIAVRRVGDIGFLHLYDLTSHWMKHIGEDTDDEDANSTEK